MSEPLIRVCDLVVGIAGPRLRPVLRGVSLDVAEGEAVGVVGESGSGKSTLALAMMGFLRPGLAHVSGEARLGGRDLFALREGERAALRGRAVALVPQNAGQALTPTLRVGAQVEEAMALAGRTGSAAEWLERVRLPEPAAIAARHPHELSGGQQQRVAIAMALASGARALLLDEPTTGLDVTTQAHILEFLRGLSREEGVAMVYVSHDLGVIARVASRIAVLYAGEVAELGTARAVLSAPAHPYARALLGAIPRLAERAVPAALPGTPPPVGEARDACAFAPRCPIARAACLDGVPPLVAVPHGEARCLFPFEAGTEPPRPQRAPSTRRDARALEVIDLAVRYRAPGPLDRLRGRAAPDTVADVDLDLMRGETVGLVGESGSGKSTILRAVAGLVAPRRGRVLAGERALAPRVSRRPRGDLRPLQTVFQNADQALNPRRTVREILLAPLRLYFDLSPQEQESRARDLMEAVRLPAAHLDRLPGQLSGGERQRVGIARAFAAEPDIVLCDEVTSALDVSVQAAALALLKRLQAERGSAYLFVSHDLAVIRAVSDRVAVLYQGRIMEIGPAEVVFEPPHHPYTAVLLGAILEPDPDAAPTLAAADAPEAGPPARGCPFQRRCPRRIGSVCDEEAPPERRPARPAAPGAGATPAHVIRCHLPLEALDAG